MARSCDCSARLPRHRESASATRRAIQVGIAQPRTCGPKLREISGLGFRGDQFDLGLVPLKLFGLVVQFHFVFFHLFFVLVQVRGRWAHRRRTSRFLTHLRVGFHRIFTRFAGCQCCRPTMRVGTQRALRPRGRPPRTAGADSRGEAHHRWCP